MSSKFNSNSFLSLSPPRPKITSPHSTCSTLTDLLISPLLSSHSSPLTQLLLHFATPSLPDPLPLSVDPHSCTMSLEASLNQSQCATLTPGHRGWGQDEWSLMLLHFSSEERNRFRISVSNHLSCKWKLGYDWRNWNILAPSETRFQAEQSECVMFPTKKCFKVCRTQPGVVPWGFRVFIFLTKRKWCHSLINCYKAIDAKVVEGLYSTRKASFCAI